MSLTKGKLPTIHIAAKNSDDFADNVIMPGDPLRVKYLAEKFLNDAMQISNVRNVLAYTGLYKNKKVSAIASGMGMPSTSIYVNELFSNYGVEKIIITGTCIAFRDGIQIGDAIIATATSTDSNMPNLEFGYNLAPCADFQTICNLVKSVEDNNLQSHVGSIFTSDFFYLPESLEDMFKVIDKYGHLAIDMESAALFTLAQRFNKRAGTILTVTDHINNLSQSLSSNEREKTLDKMLLSALDSILL